MASIDISYTRLWFLTIDDDTSHLVKASDVARTIDTNLLDPKGWKRFGYNFTQINPAYGLYLRLNKNNWKYVIHVRISMEETIKGACGFGKLSCADMAKNIIYFNVNRWLYGSKESGLSLEDYKNYLIFHEWGHLLGRGHATCSKNEDDPCPIMYQQTISKGCCRPNSYPLDGE